MNRKKRHYVKLLSGIIFLALCAIPVSAQVTIGSGQTPNRGALLDLKEDGATTKGLGLPKVKLIALAPESDDLKLTIEGAKGAKWELDTHVGLLVYNIHSIESDTNRLCPGVHVWDGSFWQPIVPYAPILERKIADTTGQVARGFEYLDPQDATGWPADKETDRQAGNYALGNSKTSQMKDREGNEYNTSRFYVGYSTLTRTYLIQRSYLCDPEAEPNWINSETIAETEKTFIDGIWSTENLRTRSLPDGTTLSKHTANDYTTPQYYIPGNKSSTNRQQGLLYNWAAAINLGNGPGRTPDPGSVDQGGETNTEAHTRGICPEGWHLPSDQEWSDLENGILRKTSLFSQTADIGETSLNYDRSGWHGQLLGSAMKTTTAINSVSTLGTSKATGQGGFDAFLGGCAYQGRDYYYGTSTNFWTASSFNAIEAWFRHLANNNNMVLRSQNYRYSLFSVRCKKD